jgi:hypothetical protein
MLKVSASSRDDVEENERRGGVSLLMMADQDPMFFGMLKERMSRRSIPIKFCWGVGSMCESQTVSSTEGMVRISVSGWKERFWTINRSWMCISEV